MKDNIKKIKNGEVQYFMPIVEQYIDIVYNNALLQNNEKDSEEVTKKVFLGLYKKILGFGLSKDIKKLIIKITEANGISLNMNIEIKSKTPPIVMRQILMQLSLKSKRKNQSVKVRRILIGVVVLALFITTAVTSRKILEKPPVVVSVPVDSSVIHSESLDENSYKYDLKTIGNNVAVLKYKDYLRQVEIWNDGKKYCEYSPKKGDDFVSFNSEDDTFVMMNGNKISIYSKSGKVKKSLKISGDIVAVSKNNKYLVLKEDKQNHVLDITELKVKNTIEGICLSVNNDGDPYIIDNIDVLEEYGYSKETIRGFAVDNQYLILIDTGGKLSKIRDGKVLWTTRVGVYNDEEIDTTIYSSKILVTQDKYFVVCQSPLGSFMSCFNKADGFKDISAGQTRHTGVIKPDPKLSYNQQAILFTTQVDDDNSFISYTGLFDVTEIPIKEMAITSDEKPYKTSLTLNDQKYFIYNISKNNVFEIIEIDKVN